MVTSTSTLAQVFAANIASPTESDLSSWTEITPLASSTISTKVGLFGADLTYFYSDCAVASAVCTASDFHDFSGWAIGAHWTWSTAATADDVTGICFELDMNCVFILAGGTNNEINAFTDTVAPAIDKPSTAGTYCTNSDHGGFSDTCWYGKLSAVADKV